MKNILSKINKCFWLIVMPIGLLDREQYWCEVLMAAAFGISAINTLIMVIIFGPYVWFFPFIILFGIMSVARFIVLFHWTKEDRIAYREDYKV